MPQTQFELRRKLLQLEALYDVGRALNTLRPEGELLEELMQRVIFFYLEKNINYNLNDYLSYFFLKMIYK